MIKTVDNKDFSLITCSSLIYFASFLFTRFLKNYVLITRFKLNDNRSARRIT